ncbi:MAG: hypothetical protein WBL19_01790 [Minisyncoccia bacterium]
MRFGTIFALLFSVVIVGLALLWRFSDTKESESVLYSVETERPDDYEEALAYFTQPAAPQATTTEPAEPKPLTETDIISRNLLLSYLGVAVGNEDIEKEDMEKVAERYLDQAVGLHKFEKIGAESLKMVADSEANARTYGLGFANIYTTYAASMAGVMGDLTATDQPENTYAQFVAPIADSYSGIATALKVLPVPVSLSLLHLELINIYLSNAAAMKSIGKMNEEPLTAMSGLVAIKENGAKEMAILKELMEVFTSKWGVIE